jgi:hypothetical protein
MKIMHQWYELKQIASSVSFVEEDDYYMAIQFLW